ncbi:hypothetical protein D3C75_967980 [compost metagenome]
MDHSKLFDVVQIAFGELPCMFLGDSALVRSQEYAVAVFQGDTRIAVLPFILAAAAAVNLQLVNHLADIPGDFIAAEFAQIRRLHAAHGSVYTEVQGISTRVHNALVDVLIHYIVANSDYLILFHKNIPSEDC